MHFEFSKTVCPDFAGTEVFCCWATFFCCPFPLAAEKNQPNLRNHVRTLTGQTPAFRNLRKWRSEPPTTTRPIIHQRVIDVASGLLSRIIAKPETGYEKWNAVKKSRGRFQKPIAKPPSLTLAPFLTLHLSPSMQPRRGANGLKQAVRTRPLPVCRAYVRATVDSCGVQKKVANNLQTVAGDTKSCMFHSHDGWDAYPQRGQTGCEYLILTSKRHMEKKSSMT